MPRHDMPWLEAEDWRNWTKFQLQREVLQLLLHRLRRGLGESPQRVSCLVRPPLVLLLLCSALGFPPLVPSSATALLAEARCHLKGVLMGA